MPEAIPRSGDEETRRITGSESTKKSEKTSSGKAAAKKKEADRKSAQKEADARAEEVRKNLENKFKDKEITPVEFKDARENLEAVTLARDEKKVVVSQEELARYKKFLVEQAGFTPGSVEKMAAADILLTAHEVDKQRGVADPKDNDYSYEVGSGEQKAEKAQLHLLRDTALSESEEQLTSKKVEGLVEIEEYKELGKKRSIGAVAGSWSDTLPDERTVGSGLGEIVRKAKRIDKSTLPIDRQAQQLDELRKELEDAIISGSFDETFSGPAEGIRELIDEQVNKLVGEVEESRTRATEEARRSATAERIDPLEQSARGLIKSIIDSGSASGSAWDGLNARVQEIRDLIAADEPSDYRKVYYLARATEWARGVHRGAMPDELKSLLGDLVNRGGLRDQLNQKFTRKYNVLSPKDRIAAVGDIDSEATTMFRQVTFGYGIDTIGAREKLSGMIGEDPEGLREWRALRSIKGLEDAVRVHQLFEPSVIWEEIPEKIANFYNFIEGTDFSVEELSATINQAITLVRNIEPDTREGRVMREKIIDELDGFRAFHSFRITLERNDMNPKRLLEVWQTYFEGKKETTWEDFVNRFGKDTKQRTFIDNSGKEVNVFDTAFRLYSERLRDDRILMNMAEEMTKYGIKNPFDHGTLEKIKVKAGFYKDEKNREFALDPEKWGKNGEVWEAKLEEMRKFFVEQMKVKGIREDQIDEHWGRIENDGLKTTKEVIEEWYKKKTLQGAFGTCESKDWEYLKSEFQRDGESDDDFKERFSNDFVGNSYLDIRRDLLLGDLESELRTIGLDVKEDDERVGLSIDDFMEELKESGYLESVDKNAYHLSWMFEWSNYDSIRLYSRDTKTDLDDIYEKIIINSSTNLFFGRQIDHVWEFFHDDNENRGRAKRNDVNEIWKQHLPGKHNYLFPQNTLMVRWAEYFMNDEQKEYVKQRTKDLQNEWDFNNEKYGSEFEGWMKSVAVMDMIENGQFTFGAQKNADGEHIKFSDVVREKNLKKFEMIDLYIDRNKHLKYIMPEALQAYLANPENNIFRELNDKKKVFYSTRAARQFPWMTLAWRAHWDIQNNHMLDLFDEPNMTSASGEKLVSDLVFDGDMEKEQGVKEKRKALGFNEIQIGGAWGIPVLTNIQLGEILGTAPFRRARQRMESSRRTGWDAKFILFALFWAGLWAGSWELAKQTSNQSTQGVGGSR